MALRPAHTRGEGVGTGMEKGRESTANRTTVLGAMAPDEPAPARPPSPGARDIPAPGKIYLFIVAAATAAAAIPPLAHLKPGTHGWGTFLLLAASAAVAQLFVVRTPRNAARYYTTIVFLIAGALLLPPELVVLIGVVQHVPEWLKIRYPWYIQTFNILNYTLDCLGAWAAAHLVLASNVGIPRDAQWALAGAAASIVFVALNHLLLATMLHFAGRKRFNETGLFTVESLSTDLVLAALGVALATLWKVNPWLIPVAIAPLVLIHRSLSVPALQEEARVDPKTGLFNARHFAAELREELARAARFERPMSLIMADLDLLREINNSYGHLAGDAVLKGLADIFRTQLRHYDVPARFGGEEFAILLPETDSEHAFEIAERIRRAVAETSFEVETSSEPIRATVSIGVAAFPQDGADANELIHQADLAVYRAKLQGRNRVLGASSEPLLMPTERGARLAAVAEQGEYTAPAARALPEVPEIERRQARTRPHMPAGPRFLALSPVLTAFVVFVSLAGIGGGIFGLWFADWRDVLGLIAIVGLVAGGQALALELEGGSISVSAVGALAGAALFGPKAALPIAVAIVAVQWSARRDPAYYVLFNIGAVSLASLAAAAAFGVPLQDTRLGTFVTAGAGLLAGAVYFIVNTGLTSGAMALEGHDRWRAVWYERFCLYGLAVFVLPLLLMRKTMAAYLGHTQKSTYKLREAAETIRSQNASLEQANRLLKERSTAAMESLSATVDARDAYTAGHSRRVQQLALAIGRELRLSQAELDLLGHAALFHDIGKLAIPDAILLKPASLTGDEWALMQRHAEEGARIIDRLGFLNDAVPAIRHHHERFDGTGYPDGLAGDDIPLGARIIHVADALDSMLTTRIYRAARPADEALQELRGGSRNQFCPRCVAALERLLNTDEADEQDIRAPILAQAS
ncbi:MAG: diguanylate cyclase [Actinobacteria bacterium]|nr:MAG: diguanylate cyclase [Actinomycetota bacterium]